MLLRVYVLVQISSNEFNSAALWGALFLSKRKSVSAPAIKYHIQAIWTTSWIVFVPFTIESTTGKTFENSSNTTCLIPSLWQYTERSFSPSNSVFTNNKSACLAAEMSVFQKGLVCDLGTSANYVYSDPNLIGVGLLT
jgi:hypothetical protein